MSIRVDLLTEAADVDALRDQLASVYRSAFCAPEYGETEANVRNFAVEQLPLHVTRAGFRMAVAFNEGDQVVGFAYGYTGHRGQWWSEYVAERAPADVVAEWLGGHFEFVELAVAQDAQRQGTGQRLHDVLLSGLPHSRALLTTYARDLPAPRLYRRAGWELLVDHLDEDNSLYGLRLQSEQSG